MRVQSILTKWNVWILIGASILLYTSWALCTGSSFQRCVSTETGADAYGVENPFVLFFVKSPIYGRCAWAVIYEFRDAVTAIATVFIGIFTATLWRSTADTARLSSQAAELAEKQFSLEGKQAELAGKQHGLQRIQFYATHRPKIEIRFVRFLRQRDDVPPENQPVSAEFVVINTGSSDAIVTGSQVSLQWLYPADIPLPTNFSGADLIPKRRFAVGATDRVTVESNELGGLNWTHDNGAKKLFLMGWVVYTDGRGEEFGDTGTTYFGRELDPKTRLFGASQILSDWDFIH